MSRRLRMLGISCAMFLLAGCEGSSSSSSSSGSSSSAQPCIDTDDVNEVQNDIDSGNGEEAMDEVIDLGDELMLIPLLGANGQCTVDPATWTQVCASQSNPPFQAKQHTGLACRQIADGVQLVRPAISAGIAEKIITTIQVKNEQCNRPERTVVRDGEDSLSCVYVNLVVTHTIQNNDGTTTTVQCCVRDNGKQIEVRGHHFFEEVVLFIAQTLTVNQCVLSPLPCP